jgi:hypothetical protein
MEYTGVARTNYFRVKDLEAFKAVLAPVDIEIVYRRDEPGIPLALLSRTGDGWPSGYLNDNEDYIDFDLIDILPAHLEDNEVAVSMEIGNEGLRHLFAVGWAVNNKGEFRVVDLGRAIMKQADELGGSHVTEPAY